MHFAKTGRHTPRPRPVQLFGEFVHLVDTVCYLGLTIGTETGRFGTSPKQEECSRNQKLYFIVEYKHKILPIMIMRAPCSGPQLECVSRNYRVFKPSDFALLTKQIGTLLTIILRGIGISFLC